MNIVIDGRSLSLTTFPWRDFMPGPSTSGDGTPLMVGLKVATADKQAFPSEVRMDRAWVTFGEQVWETTAFRSSRKPEDDGWIKCSPTPVCEATVRNGPKWGPGVYVDVVVRLTDAAGRHYLIKAPKQLIQRSD